MTTVFFHPGKDSQQESITLEKEESFLEGLLRSGYEVPFGCKGGVCQSCLMQADKGIVPSAAQRGLKQSQIEQGFFLSCCCHPESGFSAHLPNMDAQLSEAKVVEKTLLNEDVFKLRIEKTIDYRPGQFVTLWNEHNVARSYSTASNPGEDDFIEFHIKRIQNGAFSDWAWNNLETGSTIKVQGPLGDCFYTQGDKTIPIFMSGIGTGLAPLYGIARDALIQGHEGEISLYIGGKQSQNFYLREELQQLAREFNNFSVKFVAQSVENMHKSMHTEFIEGDIYQEVKKSIPSFVGVKVFLCGAESFVRKMKKQCFLAGANMREILSDPFIPFGNK